MDRFMQRCEIANTMFKGMYQEKCPKCGEIVGLAVASEKCAFLICEKCEYKFIKQMVGVEPGKEQVERG